MGANSNYPAGTWAGDPKAPWNIPDIPDEDEEEERDDDFHFDAKQVQRIYNSLIQEIYEPPIARWGE